MEALLQFVTDQTLIALGAGVVGSLVTVLVVHWLERGKAFRDRWQELEAERLHARMHAQSRVRRRKPK